MKWHVSRSDSKQNKGLFTCTKLAYTAILIIYNCEDDVGERKIYLREARPQACMFAFALRRIIFDFRQVLRCMDVLRRL